jgi:hypothetical protein
VLSTAGDFFVIAVDHSIYSKCVPNSNLVEICLIDNRKETYLIRYYYKFIDKMMINKFTYSYFLFDNKLPFPMTFFVLKKNLLYLFYAIQMCTF